MNSYVQKISSMCDLFDIDQVNKIISQMQIKDASKRMYVYWIKKHYEKIGFTPKKELIDFEQNSKHKPALTWNQVENIKLFLDDQQRFIFNLFLVSGIRISEYSVLINSPIKENKVFFKCPKNGKERYTAFPQELIDLSKQVKINLTQKQIRTIFDKIANQAIEKKIVDFKITPHTMRHTCGSLLRNKGWGYEEIADYLADDIKTVTKYYISLNGEYMKSIGYSLFYDSDETLDLNAANEIIRRKERQIQKLKDRINYLENENNKK